MKKPGLEGDGEIGIVEANVDEEGGAGKKEESQGLVEKGEGSGEEDGGDEEEDHGSLAVAQRLRCHGQRRSDVVSQTQRFRDKGERHSFGAPRGGGINGWVPDDRLFCYIQFQL